MKRGHNLTKYHAAAIRVGYLTKLRKILVPALWVLAFATSFASGWYLSTRTIEPGEHPLPPINVFVIATTDGGHWYKAYLDTDGRFKNAEDGEPLGVVVKWGRP